MNIYKLDRHFRAGLLAAALLALNPTARSADTSVALKDVFKDHFLVGTAINRNIASGASGFRRSAEQSAKDVTLVKEQFNQISPENDLKWQLVHPREGADGYDFGPADAFVNFGLSNKMYLVGHTLVWHSQTPNWVFAGTNPPPPSAFVVIAITSRAIVNQMCGPRSRPFACRPMLTKNTGTNRSMMGVMLSSIFSAS